MATITPHEARRIAAATRAHIAAGGRSSRRQLVEQLDLVEQLADALAATEKPLARLRTLEEMRETYNAMFAGVAHRFGLDIGSADGVVWDWRWGAERGQAASISGAVLDGLAAAGAKRPPPPPLDVQLRRAGVAELPGIDGSTFAAEQAGPMKPARKHNE